MAEKKGKTEVKMEGLCQGGCEGKGTVRGLRAGQE